MVERFRGGEARAMGDNISRQAAISIPPMPKEHRDYQTNNLDDAYESGWYDLQECIEQLPSADSNAIQRIQRVGSVDLISRQAVLHYPIRLDHYDEEHGNRDFVLGIESVMEYVESLPSAEPKTGHWIYHENDMCCVRWDKWECSECHKRVENKSEYCPHCGADMRGADDESTI